MSKSPYLHSVLASSYIFLLVFGISSLERFMPDGEPDTLLMPVLALSMLTLSAAIMGYLFVYQPAVLYLDGKKKEALNFFFKTVCGFALITAIVALLVFARIG